MGGGVFFGGGMRVPRWFVIPCLKVRPTTVLLVFCHPPHVSSQRNHRMAETTQGAVGVFTASSRAFARSSAKMLKPSSFVPGFQGGKRWTNQWASLARVPIPLPTVSPKPRIQICSLFLTLAKGKDASLCLNVDPGSHPSLHGQNPRSTRWDG